MIKNRKLKFILMFVVFIFCLGILFMKYDSFKNKKSINETDSEVIAANKNTMIYSFVVDDANAGYLTQTTDNVNEILLNGSNNIKKMYGCDSPWITGKYCRIGMKFVPNNGYMFRGWAVNNTCNAAGVLNTSKEYYTGKFTSRSNAVTVMACTKKIENSVDNPSTINKKCVTLNGNDSNKLAASCENTSGNGCINGECCDVSKGNCRIAVTSKEPSNYSVGTTPNCTFGVGSKTRYFNFNSNSKDINVYACKNTNSGNNNNNNNNNNTSTEKNYCTLTLYVNKSNEKWIIHDGPEKVETEGGGMYACKTSKCSVEYTGKTDNFIGITGTHKPKESEQTKWSEDPRSETSSLHQIWCSYPDEKELHVMARYSNDQYAKNFGSSSGGSSGGNTPVEEPPVVSNNEEVNSVYYAKGEGFSGSSIACGDKLYITTCTKTNDPICNVLSINVDKAVSNTQIRKSNIVKNQNETGCFQKIERYIAEKTYHYSDKGLSKDKTEISCGSIVTFKKEIKSSCDGKSCEVEYNGKTVYINMDYITSDKPACKNQDSNGDGSKTCVTSKNVTGAKGEVPVSICKKDDTEDTRNKIVSCAEDYEFKYKLTNDTCKDSNSDNCYKDYLYTCSYIKRPGVNASAGAITTGGKGTINITGVPYGDVPILGYHVSSGEEPTVNSNWSTFNAVNNSFSIERTAGTYFIWAINEKRRISYPVLAKVYDADLSTTLASFKVQDGNGNDINTNISSLDGTVGYTTGVKDSKYALLSNDLIADSVGGFDKLTTSYELSVTANKIALYATLTSSDATYVSGYEPRTIDLDYGRNVALIKIVNKDGKERCYTFIINRVDDRNNSNLLKNVKLSRGSIDFDPYTTNYDVKISRFTKKVSVNAELDSSTSKFIKGYEPREVEITEDRQSVVLKVISEAGSIRSYVITFIRNGEDKDNINSTYLSSLTVPGTMLGFDKETYDYTITVPYETEDLPIYAFAEDENATVNVGNNTGLKVGNNLIQIEVKNNNKTRIYSLHVIRKESGLDISNSARLGTLSIKNYNIEFSPDKLDYEVKIKREKTLLISATPESNRADIYMYGNNDLTGFSTIRVKVIAENGLTNIYSIDIKKAAYNKKIEIIASVAGVSALLIVSFVIYLKKKNNKKKEYLEG